jgi:hypothetical protein
MNYLFIKQLLKHKNMTYIKIINNIINKNKTNNKNKTRKIKQKNKTKKIN